MIRSGYLPTTGSLYRLREHEYTIPKSTTKRLGGGVLRAINDSARIWIGADNGQWFDVSKTFSNIQLTKEEKSMSKFNKGDKVRVTDSSIPSYYKIKYGETYTVTETYGDQVYVEGFQGFYYDSRFELDSVASTIAAVKKGDRVTVRTKVATYAEFEVSRSGWGTIIPVGGEVAITWSEIVELTITKPALSAEPSMGTIVKFQNSGDQQWQIHTYKGWLPIYSDGSFSNAPFNWEKTFNQFGPEFEVIREGSK